jgi:hypothetical protein
MSTNRFLGLVNGVQSWFTAINSSSGSSDANKIIATSSDGFLHPSITGVNKRIIYSQTAPTTNRDTYAWFETDSSNNQINQFPWYWHTTFSAWRSPIKEYFFAYRNDIDAAVPVGGRRHLILNADWWFYPANSANIPSAVWFQLGTYQIKAFNTTSINAFNGGRVSNINVDFNVSDTAVSVLECRFGSSSDYTINNRQVFANIKLEYSIFR